MGESAAVLGSSTQYATFNAADQSIFQQEQLSQALPTAGYGQTISGPLVNGSIPYSKLAQSASSPVFNASTDDCNGTKTLGWGCTPVVISEAGTVNLQYPDARIFAKLPQAFKFSSLSYSILDQAGKVLSSRTVASTTKTNADNLSSDLKTLNFSVGPVLAGQSVAFNLTLDPVLSTPAAGDAAPAEIVATSFENGPAASTLPDGTPTGGGAATFETWLASGFHYGWLAPQAIDALASYTLSQGASAQYVPVPLAGATYSASYFHNSSGVPVDLGSCLDAGKGCAYRLEPTAWITANPKAACPGASGCVTAKLTGYTPQGPVPIVPIDTQGNYQTIQPGSVTTLQILMFNQSSSPSSITGIQIINGTSIVCAWPSDGADPDCRQPSSYYLQKGGSYTLNITESVAPHAVDAGALVSLAASSQTAYFTTIPTWADELDSTGTPDGNTLPIASAAAGSSYPLKNCQAMQDPQVAINSADDPTWVELNYSIADSSNPNSQLTTQSYLLSYQFTVGPAATNAQDSLNFSFNTFYQTGDPAGNPIYFFSPAYGNSWNATWCAAPSNQFGIGLLDSSKVCSNGLCATLNYEQDISPQASSSAGFLAVSKPLWQQFVSSSTPFTPLIINGTITYLGTGPFVGKPLVLNLSTNGAHLLLQNIAFSSTCGSTTNLAAGADYGSQGGTSSLVVNLQQCQKTGKASATAFTVTAWPQTPNTAADPQTTVQLTLATADNPSNPVFNFTPVSWVNVTAPPGAYSGYATITSSFVQPLSNGGSLTQKFYSVASCQPASTIDELYSSPIAIPASRPGHG